MIRGKPEYPYLAEADFKISPVIYSQKNSSLIIKGVGIKDQKATLKVISPLPLENILLNEISVHEAVHEIGENGVFIYHCTAGLPSGEFTFTLTFH